MHPTHLTKEVGKLSAILKFKGRELFTAKKDIVAPTHKEVAEMRKRNTFHMFIPERKKVEYEGKEAIPDKKETPNQMKQKRIVRSFFHLVIDSKFDMPTIITFIKNYN